MSVGSVDVTFVSKNNGLGGAKNCVGRLHKNGSDKVEFYLIQHLCKWLCHGLQAQSVLVYQTISHWISACLNVKSWHLFPCGPI